MKLSIFTTVTRPAKRGDTYKEALSCYTDLADEVVIIHGNANAKALDYENNGAKVVVAPTILDTWPKEFSWEIIGQHFQRGYEVSSGDVVIHADLDFIFHEKDFEDIRKAAQLMLDNNLPAMSMYKYQFVLPDRYNLKSRLVIMVNKRDYGDRIKFDASGDLCQPSLDGRYLNPDSVPQSKIGFYNYEKLLKTKDQIKDDVTRMARAWHRHFGNYKLGTDETAYSEWLHMALGRLEKPHKYIGIHEHPKYVQETILNLHPDQWGYNAFGKLADNNYVGVENA